MAASPEFYKPSSTPAFSPCGSPLRAAPVVMVPPEDDDYSYNNSYRTPTGSGISYLREPTTCPPAPRKAPPPPCKKRLFQQQQEQQQGGEQVVISLRLDEFHAIFRPHPLPPADKRRRSARQRADLDAAPKQPLQA